jgi:uncharacterized membrane protein YhhN
MRQDVQMSSTKSRTVMAAAAYGALAVADASLAAKSARSGTGAKTARRLRFLTKPLLMPALATAFRGETQGRDDLLRRGTLAAQALSWGGDLALLGGSERAFLGGVGSFFAAHVAYAAGFASVRRTPNELGAPGIKAALGMWAATAPVMAVAAGRKDPGLRVPVAAYSSILTTMFATSTMIGPDVPEPARRKILVGTSLFLLSDTLLGAQEFLLSKKRPALEAAVMATYAAGQGLIAAGAADL